MVSPISYIWNKKKREKKRRGELDQQSCSVEYEPITTFIAQ